MQRVVGGRFGGYRVRGARSPPRRCRRRPLERARRGRADHRHRGRSGRTADAVRAARPPAADAAGRRPGPGPLRLPAGRVPRGPVGARPRLDGPGRSRGGERGRARALRDPRRLGHSRAGHRRGHGPGPRRRSGHRPLRPPGAHGRPARRPRERPAGFVARGRIPVPGDARRRAAERDGAPARPRPLRRRALPDGGRVLGLLAVEPRQRGGRSPASPAPSATPPCRSTCAAPAARAACSTCSTRPRWPTATTSIEIVARQPWVLHGQRRHGRPVVLGHHPALHGGHPAAAPGGGHAAVGHRRPLAAGLARRHLQLGLHRTSGSRSATRPPRPAATAGSPSASRPATRPVPGTRHCAARTPTSRASSGRSTSYPASAGARDLRRLVGDIEAPVFISGAFQDEQTGPQFTAMLDDFDVGPGRAREPVERAAPRRLRPRQPHARGSSSSSSTSPSGCHG